jgi:hypothetical protein
MPNTDYFDWRELEAQTPLENLPDFHRAFLRSRGVTDPDKMMLRRVQQAVERELNTLLKNGEAMLENERLWVKKSVLEAITQAG